MIWPAIRRILAVAFAFVLAVATGVAMLLTVGVYWAAREVVSYAPENADALERFMHETLGAMAFLTMVTPVLTLLPAVLAAVTGEIARIRSWLYYVAAGGAAGAAMPLFSPPRETHDWAYSAPLFGVMATAGFAAGLVYWAVAGRRA